jgi:dolichol-phosphate mannosyltransferase
MLVGRRVPHPAREESRDQRRAWRFIQVSTLVPLAVFESSAGRLPACIRSAWQPTIMVMLLIYGAGLYYLAIGIPGTGYSKHVELLPVGWRELGSQISTLADEIHRATGKAPLIVGMDRYAIASELAFYAPDRTQSVSTTSSAHLFGQMGLMYERWFPPQVQYGRTIILVAWNRDDLDAGNLRSSVERMEPIQEGDVRSDGEFIRHYFYRIAYGYRGLPD